MRVSLSEFMRSSSFKVNRISLGLIPRASNVPATIIPTAGGKRNVTPGWRISFPPGRTLISLSTIYSPEFKNSRPSTSPPTKFVPGVTNRGTNVGFEMIVLAPGLLLCNKYGKYSIFARLYLSFLK